MRNLVTRRETLCALKSQLFARRSRGSAIARCPRRTDLRRDLRAVLLTVSEDQDGGSGVAAKSFA